MDGATILSPNIDPADVSLALRHHLNLIYIWSLKWKIKINAHKFALVPFTFNKNNSLPLIFQGLPVQSQLYVKYLGIVIDKRFTWTRWLYLKANGKLLNTRLHILRPKLKSNFPLKNKLLIHKSMIRPIWSYGAQIWCCAKSS